jgi:YD repeat-containing protein
MFRDSSRNIIGVIDPLGHRSTDTWDTSGNLRGYSNPNAARSTLSFVTLANLSTTFQPSVMLPKIGTF